MCNSKVKTRHGLGFTTVAQIDGRPVLQPTCNRVIDPAAAATCTLKKSLSFPSTTPPTNAAALKPANKRANDPNSLNSSTEKPPSPKSTTPRAATAVLVRKKSKKSTTTTTAATNYASVPVEIPLNYKATISSLFDVNAPGSLAAAQREQATLIQAQRKMKIAHYGRTTSKLEANKVAPVDPPSSPPSSSSLNSMAAAAVGQEEKRCSFITPNSDPLFVAYHDGEWGVPVHDDKMLLELLVLTGAQVGLDWTTILKKRDDFRAAFAGFDAEVISKFSERQIVSISSEYGIDLGKVRGIVDNSNRVLEVKKEFGSLDKYLWGFVNHNPISTQYKSCRKIPVKTSKSESISKDMVRRGFRFVGPTIVHSFMQAAGLTNDHLVTCLRHRHCSSSSITTTN